MSGQTKWLEYPLSTIEPGEYITIGGQNNDKKMVEKLTSIGLRVGASCTVVSGRKNFPFVLKIESGATIGICWDIARDIMVRRARFQGSGIGNEIFEF